MKGDNPTERLQRIFAERWDKPFLTDGKTGETITYGKFIGISEKIKKFIVSKGAKQGDTVCTIMQNSPFSLAVIFAFLLGRIVFVPIDPKKGEREISEIIDYSNCRYVLCDKKSDIKIEKKVEVIDGTEFVSGEESKEYLINCLKQVDPDILHMITFTSGSTGKPKGVMHSFRNLFFSAMAFSKKFGFEEKNVFYHNLPMAYMAGILNLFWLPLLSKSRIVVGERFNVKELSDFWNIPAKYGANTFWFIPTIVALLVKLDRGIEGVEYCRKTDITACVGTAPLGQNEKKRFEQKYNVKLYESYGLSETLFVSTNHPKIGNNDLCAGELLDGATIQKMSDGELKVKVPWMFLGYSNIPEWQGCSDGYFLSGDIGEVDSKNMVKITGRKKDLIIRGGVNISPRRLEEEIMKTELVDEIVIMGLPDEVLGEKIVCFFIPKTADDAKRTIRKVVIEELGADYNIDEFVILDEIPKNINGKTDKIRIKKEYLEGRLNDN